MARRNSDDLRLLPTLKKFYRIRILRWKKHSFKWFAKMYESFLGMIFMPYLFTTREMWRRSGQKFWKLGNMSSDHNLLYQTYRVTTIHFSGESHFHEYVNPFWLSVRPFYGKVNIFAVRILQSFGFLQIHYRTEQLPKTWFPLRTYILECQYYLCLPLLPGTFLKQVELP